MLEAEEFQNALGDGGVEAEAAFVGADGVVKLDAPCAVCVDLAVVIFPCDAEGDDAVWLCHALEDVGVSVVGVICGEGDEGFDDFVDGLVEFFFAGVSLFEAGHEGFDFFFGVGFWIHRGVGCRVWRDREMISFRFLRWGVWRRWGGLGESRL